MRHAAADLLELSNARYPYSEWHSPLLSGYISSPSPTMAAGSRGSMGGCGGGEDESTRKRQVRLLKNREAAKECRRKKKVFSNRSRIFTGLLARAAVPQSFLFSFSPFSEGVIPVMLEEMTSQKEGACFSARERFSYLRIICTDMLNTAPFCRAGAVGTGWSLLLYKCWE